MTILFKLITAAKDSWACFYFDHLSTFSDNKLKITMNRFCGNLCILTSSLALLILYLYFISNISEQPLQQPSPSDWSPNHDELTSWTNSAPMLHCPHGSDRRDELLKSMQDVAALRSKSSCSDCPKDITFVFVTNLAVGESPLVEKLYRLCGCRFVHIRLSKDKWPGWQWIYKVSRENVT